ncbi:MAG: Rdx family protein [Nitrososphaerota archaeon]|jgi:selT/selW/selH-like putative selenoprotein|nr:Rdx family protein [Nitrososphaerota archaeon]MDG6941966.1 Rdx family protein [Nitrososphaerota archaeon]
MEYQFEFCVSCYLPRALELASAIMEGHAHDDDFVIKLKPGANGQFDVVRDGNVIYSKAKTNQFPQPGELDEGLRTRISLETSRAGNPCC